MTAEISRLTAAQAKADAVIRAVADHDGGEAPRLMVAVIDPETNTRLATGFVAYSIVTADRCPAAHAEDPTPCVGPVVVTVLDRYNAGANGCEHHGARLLASLEGGRVYPLPDAPEGSAIRVFKAADTLRPFPWLTDAPRTAPNMLSLAENRRAEGDQR